MLSILHMEKLEGVPAYIFNQLYLVTSLNFFAIDISYWYSIFYLFLRP